MKIGDAADEILNRPAFGYAKERMDVELTLVSAENARIPDRRLRTPCLT
jgi:hypothetical protein